MLQQDHEAQKPHLLASVIARMAEESIPIPQQQQEYATFQNICPNNLFHATLWPCFMIEYLRSRGCSLVYCNIYVHLGTQKILLMTCRFRHRWITRSKTVIEDTDAEKIHIFTIRKLS